MMSIRGRVTDILTRVSLARLSLFTIKLYMEYDISLKIIGGPTDGFIHRGLEAP